MAKRKQYVVNGLLLSNVRYFCDFMFGKFYIDANINRDKNIVEVFLRTKLNVKQENGEFKEEVVEDYVDMERFNKFWKGRLEVLKHDKSED